MYHSLTIPFSSSINSVRFTCGVPRHALQSTFCVLMVKFDGHSCGFLVTMVYGEKLVNKDHAMNTLNTLCIVGILFTEFGMTFVLSGVIPSAL